MTGSLPPTQQRVSLKLAHDRRDIEPMPVESLEVLLARARAMGLPLHHDPQIAALLVSLRLREEVPTLLYAAVSCVLASIYEAAEEA